MSVTTSTKFLSDLWDGREATALEARPLDLLRYRSNRLGDDLRITCGPCGGTTVSVELPVA